MKCNREPKQGGFEPAPNCENPDKCRTNGLCWGSLIIRNERNEKESDCDHPRAEEARQEVRDLYDLNKPLKP